MHMKAKAMILDGMRKSVEKSLSCSQGSDGRIASYTAPDGSPEDRAIVPKTRTSLTLARKVATIYE